MSGWLWLSTTCCIIHRTREHLWQYFSALIVITRSHWSCWLDKSSRRIEFMLVVLLVTDEWHSEYNLFDESHKFIVINQLFITHRRGRIWLPTTMHRTMRHLREYFSSLIVLLRSHWSCWLKTKQDKIHAYRVVINCWMLPIQWTSGKCYWDFPRYNFNWWELYFA